MSIGGQFVPAGAYEHHEHELHVERRNVERRNVDTEDGGSDSEHPAHIKVAAFLVLAP